MSPLESTSRDDEGGVGLADRGRRVVATDHAFADLDRERSAAITGGAAFEEASCTTEAETLDAVRGADVVLVNMAPITRRVLEALAPGASVIRYGVGYDNVDVVAARELGITVAVTPSYGTDTVADHAASLLLATLRRLPLYDRAVRADGWAGAMDFGPLPAFADVVVGLVGTGRIGLALAARLHGFGFTVVAHDPYIDPEVARAAGIELLPLDAVLSRAQALSLHLPLNDGTRHLIDARALALLPRGAVVVNTARGGLIDAEALADAIVEGRLAAAGLDVFDDEPLSSDSRLRELAEVILTPHVAFYSTASLERLQQTVAEEVARALTGEPLVGRVS